MPALPLLRRLTPRVLLLRLLAALALAVLAAHGAAASPWPDYPIIEWQHRTPAQFATLRALGVTAAAAIADRDGTGTPLTQQTAPLRAAGLRWYIENIATDFYAAYHRWTPGHPPNQRFLDAQRRYRDNPGDPAPLMREPSLSDPAWQARIDARLAAIVQQQHRFDPLFYSLGDETGIADLAAFWDFDLSPESRAGMRLWLRRQYGSLAALNAEWGTRYATWHDVQPETTRVAMRRTDGNFAAWADFKAWMDVAFATALRRGTDAVHAADPHARAGIEGVQIPGWGGYDMTRLAHAVDVAEIYDAGENLPILRSLDPHLILLTTSFGAAPADIHGIWRELLRGTSGLILWDDNDSIVGADGTLGARGETYAKLFATLHRVAPAIRHAVPYVDPVAILYSPASFRTQWMLDQQPHGDAWMARDAEAEWQDNAYRRALHGYAQSLSQLGLQPRFVTAAMLPGLRARMLVLPDALALSPADARAIAAFAARSGIVVADTQPGRFDAHSRRLPRPSVAPSRLRMAAPDDRAALAALCAQAGVAAPFRVASPDVEMHVFTTRSGFIVALQRAAGAVGNAAVTLALPRPMQARELVSERDLGHAGSLRVTLDPVTPALIALTAPR
jgi:hypothetical protein